MTICPGEIASLRNALGECERSQKILRDSLEECKADLDQAQYELKYKYDDGYAAGHKTGKLEGRRERERELADSVAKLLVGVGRT